MNKYFLLIISVFYSITLWAQTPPSPNANNTNQNTLPNNPFAGNVKPDNINYSANNPSNQWNPAQTLPNNINPSPNLPVNAPVSQPTYQMPPTLPPVNATSRLPTSSSAPAANPAIDTLNIPDERIRGLKFDIFRKGGVLNEPPSSPKPVTGFVNVNLSPGAGMPVIRLYKDRSTSLVLTDVNGTPWPIVNYEISNNDFSIRRLDRPAPDGHILAISPANFHVSGNLILYLKDLPIPVILELITAQREVDYRVDVRIQARGPNANQEITIDLPESLDMRLLSVLQGVTPPSTRELVASHPAIQVWLTQDNKMLVRSRYRLTAPPAEGITTSPDGTFAYRLPPVPVLQFSYGNGKYGEVVVNGF